MCWLGIRQIKIRILVLEGSRPCWRDQEQFGSTRQRGLEVMTHQDKLGCELKSAEKRLKLCWALHLGFVSALHNWNSPPADLRPLCSYGLSSLSPYSLL